MRYIDLFIDFDDTLYDTRGNAIIALGEVFAEYHLEEYFPDAQVFNEAYWQTNVELWAQYSHGEITRDTLILERFRRPLSIGMGDKATEDYCLRMSDTFLDRCSNKPGTIDGAKELLEHLTKCGYRLHICSNGFSEIQSKKLAACGLRPFFQTVVLSEEAGANKPSKLFFDYALQQTGARPETTLMIGDNYYTDMEGAMTEDMDTMLFNRWDKEFVPPRPVTYQVDTLREIMNIL